MDYRHTNSTDHNRLIDGQIYSGLTAQCAIMCSLFTFIGCLLLRQKGRIIFISTSFSTKQIFCIHFPL